MFKAADQFGKVTDQELEEGLKRKREITLANHAVDEVKQYVQA